jgi:hypothetical protein
MWVLEIFYLFHQNTKVLHAKKLLLHSNQNFTLFYCQILLQLFIYLRDHSIITW